MYEQTQWLGRIDDGCNLVLSWTYANLLKSIFSVRILSYFEELLIAFLEYGPPQLTHTLNALDNLV